MFRANHMVLKHYMLNVRAPSTSTLRRLSDFSRRKQGTGNGPFIELPDIKLSQDSITLRMPAFCTIHGKLDMIIAATSEGDNDSLIRNFSNTNTHSRFSTQDTAVNLVLSSPFRNLCAHVVQIDSYKTGLYISQFEEAVVCYSGDLFKDGDNMLKGYGVAVIAGRTPIHKLILDPEENITIPKESLLAYDSSMAVKPANNVAADSPLSKMLTKYIGIKFQQYWGSKQVYLEVSGPGTVFLQNA